VKTTSTVFAPSSSSNTRYRLFFRFHAPSKTIVYAWVNDQDTKRAYESSNDAYRVFGKMLAALLTASKVTRP